MTRSLPLELLLSCVLGGSVLGCGGATDLGPGDSTAGGTANESGGAAAGGGAPLATGGTPAEGGTRASGGAGSGGDPGIGSSTGTGGSDLVCCLAEATCNAGDTQIASETDCPPGASCYEASMCCSTVWCVNLGETQCDAYPVCPQGTTEVQTCPEGGDCFDQTLCGTTIACLKELAPANCNTDAEYNRKYVTFGPDSCPGADFTCEEGTTAFDDPCGCGCEQPASCPEFIDCMPGTPSSDSSLCENEDCPYTRRAY